MSKTVDTVISYLIPFFSKSESFKKFKQELGDATIDWIRPLFLKDDETPSEEASDLANAPDDEINQQAAKVKLVKLARNLENGDQLLKELAQKLRDKSGSLRQYIIKNQSTVKGDRNQIIQGTINTTIK